MPRTLYTYILKDLIRLLVLSSTVLVLVISFAAAIEPLTKGQLGPWLLIKYVLYGIPTTLTVVLPFSCAYAATIVFTRMATDNEIMACSASGLSYRSILIPVAVVGLLLCGSLYYLSNWVVPWFYHRLELMLHRDLPSLIVEHVKTGRPLAIGDGNVMYADSADELVPSTGPVDTGVAPYRLIMVRGVAIGKFDRQHILRDITTTSEADIYLYRHEGHTWAQLHLQNVMTLNQLTGNYATIKKPQIRPFAVPSPFKDDPRFLSWPNLVRLATEPRHYEPVQRKSHQLARHMAQHRLLGFMTTHLDRSIGNGTVILQADEHEQYILSTPSVELLKTGLYLSGNNDQPVRVERRSHGLLALVYESPSADLSIKVSPEQPEPMIKLEMAAVTVTDRSSQNRKTQKKAQVIRNIRWPQPILQPLLAQSPREMRAQARMYFRDSVTVQQADKILYDSIDKLRRKIKGHIHERAALSGTNIFVLLLGSLLSIYLRGSTPLTIYFWTFVLTAISVFVTRSGENVASDANSSVVLGLSIIHLGNLVLCAVVIGIYWKLSRN
ncbi:MAG: hypothetical protein CMJ20_01250 [Phycisphaeraceae bacterium]|nr:hypothetical protein [Phycisphaeraceae bacterium]